MDHSGWPDRAVQRSGHGGGSCSGYWPDAPASPPGESTRRHWRIGGESPGGDWRASGGGHWGGWDQGGAASPGSPETIDPAWANWQPTTGRGEEEDDEPSGYMAPRPKQAPRRAAGPPPGYAPGLADFQAWPEAEAPEDTYKGLEEKNGIDEADLRLVSGMCAVLLPGGRCAPGSLLCVLAYELSRTESDIWRVVVASVGRFGRKFGASEDPWGRVWVYPRNIKRCRYRAAKQSRGVDRRRREHDCEGSDGGGPSPGHGGRSPGPPGSGSDAGGIEPGGDAGVAATGGCGGGGDSQRVAGRPGLQLAEAPGPQATQLEDEEGDPPSLSLSTSPVVKRERSRSAGAEPGATVTFGGMLKDTQAAGPTEAATGASRPDPATGPTLPGAAAPAGGQGGSVAGAGRSDDNVSLEVDEDLLVDFEDIWSVKDAATDGGSVGGQ